jgi:hypothetical protein
MRFLKSTGVALVLALVGLGVVCATPGQTDAQRYRWHGWNSYPYYWNGSYYNTYSSPYYSYSPYRNWYGNYGGYYWNYPYYNTYRTYPWGWYW